MEQDGSSEMKANTSSRSSLRWFVGIPVVSNPLMSVDILFTAAVTWICGTVFVAAIQFLIGDGLSYPALLASLTYAGYIAGAILAAFLFVGLFLLNNRYAALYKFENAHVYCENMRGTLRGKEVGFMRYRPYPIKPLLDPFKSSSKTIPWQDIYGVLPVPVFRAMILKGKRGGSLMKVYCPDDATYTAALGKVRAVLAER